MRIKKALSIILAVVMVACMMPMSVFAVEGVAKIGTTGYATLQEAVNAGNNTTITLLENTNENIVIPAEKTVTIDLNGNTISHEASTAKAAIDVSGDLTITGTGLITGTPYSSGTYWDGLLNIRSTGKVTMNGGTIDGVNCYNGAVTVRGGEFDFVGGTIKATSYQAAVYVKSGKFVQDGGVITDCAPAAIIPTSDGFAVYIDSGAVYELKSGEIKNVKPDTSAESGALGAVYVEGSSMLMSGGTISGCEAYGAGAIYVDGTSTLTFTGGTIENCKTITTSGGAVTSNGTINISGTALIQNCTSGGVGAGLYVLGGTTTMTGGTIKGCNINGNVTGGNSSQAATGKSGKFIMSGTAVLDGNEVSRGLYVYGTAEMNGGTIQNGYVDANNGAGVYVATGAAFSLTDGTITNCSAGKDTANNKYGNGGGIWTGGSTTVSGGTISNCSAAGDNAARNENGGASVYVRTGSIAVTGGTIGEGTVADGCVGESIYVRSEATSASVSGGAFGGSVYSQKSNIISGGTFSESFDNSYLAENCVLRVNKDGSTTVLDTVVAKIDDTPYGTLEEAVAAAADGDEIVLQSDIALTDVLFIDKEVTLDLNGKKITPAGSTIYSELPKDRDTLIIVKYGGNLTINATNGGEINAGNNEKIYAAIKLTSVGETYTETVPTAAVTINGGKIAGYYYGIVGNGNRHNTSVTVNDGIITSNCKVDGQGIYNPQSGTVTITGGELVGYCSAIEMRAGTLNVTGGTFTATATTYSTAPSGSGTTTTGAAIAIAQHTTGKELIVNISNATISGTKSVSVADPNNVKQNNVEVTLGDATYNGELAYSAETAAVTNDGAELTVPAEYDWYNDELVTTTDAHLSTGTVDEGGLMGHQDKIGASGVGRTIIGLTSAQLSAICASGEDLVIIGGDMGKQTTISADCAYTYFYNGDTQITAESAGCAAFIIIDGDADSAAISGYGYYRIYSGTTDNFLFDVMYANPNA